MAIESFRDPAERINPTSDNGMSLAFSTVRDIREAGPIARDSELLPPLRLAGLDDATTGDEVMARGTKYPRPFPIPEPTDDLPDWPAI